LPEHFATDENYQYRAITLLNKFLEEYKDFPSVAGIGVGTSFLANSEKHSRLIASLAQRIKAKTNKLSYASFIGSDIKKIDNLDLYGIELFSEDPYLSLTDLSSIGQRIGKNRLFISEATYPNYYGSGSGYSYKFSTEAQAKYFEDIIKFAEGNQLCGFFINTLKNYIGDYSSLYSKYSDINSYNIGLTGDAKNQTTIPNKVISSKLKGTERVTIPIGSAKDDSPIFIIFAGLILAVLMAILINSKKKFREDSTRALLRPYNFYSDIRDQRILSGFHTIALMFILAGSHALLLTNLFYYVKNNILFEKVLLAFANRTIMESASYLAWHPANAFIYAFIFSILLFLLLALLIKAASFFVRTKVQYLKIYFVVIWAFLPMAILLPVKLILYRVLVADIINVYIYVFLGVYFVWIVQRIIKGVYVIFDTSRTAVYFYSVIILILLVGSVLLFSQLYYSSIYYIITAFEQFQIM
jgi:beta-galactosidase